MMWVIVWLGDRNRSLVLGAFSICALRNHISRGRFEYSSMLTNVYEEDRVHEYFLQRYNSDPSRMMTILVSDMILFKSAGV